MVSHAWVGEEGSRQVDRRQGYWFEGPHLLRVTEFGFELRVCAHLEASTDAVVARQLGGGAIDGGRVLDVVLIEPGPGFEHRTRLTPDSIPASVLDADLGPGNFRDWRRILGSGISPQRAIERAIEIGYLEVDRTGGRELVKPVDRYPEDWFDRIIAIENKPDLQAPGDLYDQLQFDVSLGLVDEVILATASHVTRAHLNRIPDEVGVWRVDPETGVYEVHRSPASLPVEQPGLEVREHHPGRTDVRPIPPPIKRTARRRLAERAYGKGWRTYSLPSCANIDPSVDSASGLPWCTHFDRLVHPSSECSSACSGYQSAPPPAVDLEAIRDDTSPWVADPPDRRTRQGRLSDGW